MNMPIAETKDMDLNALTDNELDDVNGGFIFLALAYIGAATVGAAVGAGIGSLVYRLQH